MYLFRYKIHVYTYNSLRHLWMQLRGQVQPFGPGAGGIVWDGAVPGSRGWDKWKISSLWFCVNVLFLAQFTRWLLTSRLRIFKDKRRNFETRPSPLSKIGENAFGAPFLQLYRKNDEGDPIFYFMISIRTVLPLNEDKIGINLCSVFFEGQFY